MITPKVGKAMATAATRHNSVRQQKLSVFYKALETIKVLETIKSGESKTIFSGTMRGKKAEIFLLNGGQITLNLTVENKTFAPLIMTETVNENDYLAWNAKIRVEIDYPQQEQATPTVSRPNKISNPKAVNQKARKHKVTPLDHDTFRVKSGNSDQEYLVRLLPGEDGGTCNCNWGQHRKYNEGYKSGCSHVLAVYQQMEGQRNRSTSAWSSMTDAKRQKRMMSNIGDGVVLTLRKRVSFPALVMVVLPYFVFCGTIAELNLL